MGKISRTQKYAEIRDNIAQNREESLLTEDLSLYEGKLRRIESNGGREPDDYLNKGINNVSRNDARANNGKSLDDILDSMMDFNDAGGNSYDYENDDMELTSVRNLYNSGEIEAARDEIFGKTGNSFINDTLRGVDDYNRRRGRQTLDNIQDTLVDEFRHPNGRMRSDYYSRLEENNAYSNNVSMGIDSVLGENDRQDEYARRRQYEQMIEFSEPKIPANFGPDDVDISYDNVNTNVPDMIEGEPVVEIKNINETMNMQKIDSNVVKDTTSLDTVSDDELDDSAPNSALNVILGILIFVLIAVLGVIIYYILVAKGIIG